MPGEPNFTKVLCLIDVWKICNGPIEVRVKNNICSFLNRLKGNKDIKIYFYTGITEADPDVAKCLENTNYEITNDSLEVFRPREHVTDYYFAGFATNLCLFSSEIGIEKYLQINSNKSNFYIVEDLTAPTNIENKCIEISDLEYLNAGNCNLSEDYIVTQNYRYHIILNKFIQSCSIIEG